MNNTNLARKRTVMVVIMMLCVMLFAVPTHAATKKAKLGQTKNVTISVGQSMKLRVTGTKKPIKWRTSNKKVVAVNAKGKITVKKAGKAVITAKCGKKKAKFNVTALKNVYRCAQQDPGKWTFTGYSSPMFNTLNAFYKNGKLYVEGFWANPTFFDYSRICGRVSIYDARNNKLIAQKDVTYLYPLMARTYGGKITYVFSGNELKAKNYDLRTMSVFTDNAIFY